MYAFVNGKTLLLFGQSSYHIFGYFITTLINVKKTIKTDNVWRHNSKSEGQFRLP